MANDWDLFAIVRSCSAAKYPKRAGNDGNEEVEKSLFNFDGLFTSGNYEDDVRSKGDDPFDELQNVYRPFYRKAQPDGVSISVAVAEDSACGGSENKHQRAECQSHQEKPELPQRQQQGGNTEKNGVGSGRRIPSQAPGRRRKSRPRLMMRINAKTLSRDSWSWRKYGQKPIKGSPYPRNYYRCSTLKACSARKQVELSQDNPEEYIVSYIGDHIHARPTTRRSLAGTARNPPPAAPTSVTDLSPTTPLTAHYNNKTQKPDTENENENSEPMFEDEEEEEEADILTTNMQMSEETFMAMHVLNSRDSQPTIAEPHSPAKNSINAAGSSD
ncbi:WRKY transcription factor 22 [Vitis vinifera]|uniref:WRKY transcription factor 22 n=1 Tax=Vitis vinifera TaxID=29760 RepID=A0A438E2J4_VITVI|nr:WRKY transcription factor 22 [Vitis vinifera]